jgi:hypothetical protein
MYVVMKNETVTATSSTTKKHVVVSSAAGNKWDRCKQKQAPIQSTLIFKFYHETI